ncbi:fatty acyl-CoA reductase wat-like [Zophobas morio]|uniref:fatty acyl-CoA reductase wat-like n=1 Tax=Zophobas morio TaxID=2755281 RepID=UPI00308293EB
MALSQIQEFYKNQTVFITGTTGLLGKLVLRKLLTSCEPKKIYLLIRQHKDKSPEERLEILLERADLRRDKSEFKGKISVIEGDCSLPGLGISQDDRETLVNETTCIIHVAAIVKFSEHLRLAAYVNVRAVQDLLHLAKQVRDLKAMVHVSTAYSNCNQKDLIKEQFYEPGMTATKLMKMLESTDDETITNNTPELLGSWPNTYTFTKAVAENVIKTEAQDMPICIVRPGIVVGALQEPAPGWQDTIQGITAFFIGAYLGLIHCQLADTKPIYLIPSDYTANIILAAACYATEKSSLPPIYNYTGSEKNLLTKTKLYEYGKVTAKLYPSAHVINVCFVISTTNKYYLKFLQFWLHLVPAYIVDLICLCLGKKRRFVKMYQKLHKVCGEVGYFNVNFWKYETSNSEMLWKALTEKDRELFPFNMENLEWKSFFEMCSMYARIHFLKDPMHTLPQAKRKRKCISFLYYCIAFALVCVLWRLC